MLMLPQRVQLVSGTTTMVKMQQHLWRVPPSEETMKWVDVIMCFQRLEGEISMNRTARCFAGKRKKIIAA